MRGSFRRCFTRLDNKDLLKFGMFLQQMRQLNKYDAKALSLSPDP